MAYPFAEMPTFDEFVKQLQRNHNIEYKDEGGIVFLPSGPRSIRYLEKTNDEIYRAVVDLNGTERLTPSVLRSICKRLNISPAEFGLYLD